MLVLIIFTAAVPSCPRGSRINAFSMAIGVAAMSISGIHDEIWRCVTPRLREGCLPYPIFPKSTRHACAEEGRLVEYQQGDHTKMLRIRSHLLVGLSHDTALLIQTLPYVQTSIVSITYDVHQNPIFQMDSMISTPP
jgi:hypothetical protein